MRRVSERTGRLSGVRVLVTRPEPAAARLADAFAAEGAVVHRVPALAIAPVGDTRSADRLRRRLGDVSVIVFTSVNAVEGFFGLGPVSGVAPVPDPVSGVAPVSGPVSGVAPVSDPVSGVAPVSGPVPGVAPVSGPVSGMALVSGPVPGVAPARLPGVVLAVGRATAEALRARGVADVRTPRGRLDSEGLLACPQLAARQVAGRLVAVVKGEGGRDLLGRALVRRGAEVVEADVYRRRAPDKLAGMLEEVRESVDVVTVTSAEALANLAGAAPWTVPWLSDRVLVAVSERVAGIARARRLSRVAVAAGADAASIVDAAARAGRTIIPARPGTT